MTHIATSPLITIGITCFNAEDTIARAIESAQNQDWPNFEIIVVDDCSGDDSVKVINNCARTDKRISLHSHKKNGGLPAALNTIIKNARGEYIAFFDDDDESMPSRITKQYERLSAFEAAHPGKPVLCYCNRRVLKDGIERKQGFGGIMGYEGIGHKAPEPHGTMIADFYFLRVKTGNHVFGGTGTCTTFASKNTFKQFGYDKNIRRAEDWDMAIRVGLSGGYCIAVNEPLVNWHETQTADKAGHIALDQDMLMAEKHKAYLQSAGIYRAAIAHAHARFYRKRNIIKCIFFLIVASVLSPRVFLGTINAIISTATRGKTG